MRHLMQILRRFFSTGRFRTVGMIRRRIENLNLDCIKIKLMKPDSGEGWSRQKCDELEKVYKNFLLSTVIAEIPIVPFKDLDEFWHTHILDTEKYARDCKYIFGAFLHHFPYFGLRGEKDKQNLKESFAEASEWYEKFFGTPYLSLEFANCGDVNCQPPSCKELQVQAKNCGTCGANHCGSCSWSGFKSKFVKVHWDKRPSFAYMDS